MTERQLLTVSLLVASIAAGFVLGGCDTGSESGGTAPAADSPSSDGTARKCEGVPNENRWPDRFLGGPSSGPIAFATGRDKRLFATRTPDGEYLFAKTLLIVDGPTNSALRLNGAEVSTGESAYFTHLDQSSELPPVPGPSEGAVPDRGQSESKPADIPGYLMAQQPGCYLVEVTLAGEAYGPFAFRLIN